MQTSFNLALGSALATIGLTIPAVAVTSSALGLRLDLGLPAKEMILLVLTLMISAMTVAGGRSTVLQGPGSSGVVCGFFVFSRCAVINDLLNSKLQS